MIHIWKKYFAEPTTWAKEYCVTSRNYLNLGLAGLLLNVGYPGYFWFLLFSPNFAFLDLPNDLSSVATFSRVEGVYKYKYGGKSSWPQVCISDSSSSQYLACADPRAPAYGLIGQAGKQAYGYVFKGVGLVELYVDGRQAMSARQTQEYHRELIYKSLGLLCWTVLMLSTAFLRQYDLLIHRQDHQPAHSR